jgi:octanoyl-[GcvH]:protein N-octanoyltransferase
MDRPRRRARLACVGIGSERAQSAGAQAAGTRSSCVTRPISLYTESFAERAAFDTGVSRALLHAAARGEARESLRLHVPPDVVAFSVLDRARPGFREAVAAAHEAGWGAILRLAGGRAAVFHRETIAFAWCIPDPEPRGSIAQRFEWMASVVARTLQSLGVDARIGAVPGEYCPGDHSVNARGLRKLMGVGQRLVKGAAHVGGVIVVRDSARVREALAPVYAAMGVDWDPASAGAVEDEVPGTTRENVLAALQREIEREAELVPERLDPRWLAEAATLASEHEI